MGASRASQQPGADRLASGGLGPASGARPATAVLFVCLGNICRSPQAEGIFRQQVAGAGLQERFIIDSAGTSSYHQGELADWRTRQASAARGVELLHRSRPFDPADFERFDHILVMDHSNLRDVLALAAQPHHRGKVELLRSYDSQAADSAVPDPYSGGADGFDRVFDMCELACAGLLRRLTAQPQP